MRVKQNLSFQFVSVTRGLLIVLIFLLPLFFLPLTLDALEFNKQTLLLVLTFVSVLTWMSSMLIAKRLEFRTGWINILPVALLVAFGVSAWKSPAPFLSWVGGSSQEYTSFLTLLGLVLLFYLVLNLLTERSTHRLLYFVLNLSALVVASISLLDLFIGKEIINTVGSLNATGMYLVVMTLFGLSLWVSHRVGDSLIYQNIRGIIEQGMIVLLSLLTFFYLLALDYWLLWFLFEIGLVLLFLFAFFRLKDFSTTNRFFLPITLFICALPFWLWSRGPLSVSVPVEITINYQQSQNIIERAFDRVSPFFGSGPGTYTFLYAREHEESVNQTEFYKTRFDRASSFIFTLVPTVGSVGIIFFLLFFGVLGVRAFTFLFHSRGRDEWFETYVVLVPWIVLVVCSFLYYYNITLFATLFLMSGLLGSQVFPQKKITLQEHTIINRLFTWVFIFFGSLVCIVGIFVLSQRYIAEVAYAKAVRSDRQAASLSEVVAWLDTAATLNRFDDRAYRTLAQALLLRVQEHLQTVSSADELTDESKTYLQSLVASTVNASVRATDLSPENSLNWLMRGTIYRELMNIVPNAATFAISAFEQTIVLDPVNPVNWTELGITYLVAAEVERPLTAAKDADVAEQANVLVHDYEKKGEEALLKAIDLKSNYAPAHYQLGLAYERQGRLDDAIGKMESVAKYNSKDVGVAFQLGQLYLRRAGVGDQERAKNAFEYAIMLTPSYSNARWFLASIYEKEGDLNGAIKQIEKVLEFNPGNDLVKSRLDRLKKGETSKEAPTPLP